MTLMCMLIVLMSHTLVYICVNMADMLKTLADCITLSAASTAMLYCTILTLVLVPMSYMTGTEFVAMRLHG